MQNPEPEWQLFGLNNNLPSWLDRVCSAFATAGVELPKARLLNAAHTALDKLRPDDALRAFQVAGVPPPPDALAQCGNRCFDAGMLDEAVRVFSLLNDLARLRDCANAFLAQGNNIPRARFLYHHLGTSLPLEKVRELADARFQKGNLTGAIEAYAEINAVDRLEVCAQECLSRGWFYSAQQVFDRLKIPKPVEEILAAAQACLEQGRVMEAIDGFGTAGVKPPLEPLRAYVGCLLTEIGEGRTYDTRRRLDRILRILLDAMRVEDDGARQANDFVLRLAAECVDRGQLEVVHTLLSFLGDDPSANSFDKARLAASGCECLRQGYIFDAEVFFKATSNEFPSSKFQELGERYLEQGRYRDALDAYQIAGVPVPRTGLLAWGKAALRNGEIWEARIAFERAGTEMSQEELLVGADESMRRGHFALAKEMIEGAVSLDAAREWATRWGHDWLDQGIEDLAQRCFEFAGVNPSEDATVREKFLACGWRYLETFEREGDRVLQQEFRD